MTTERILQRKVLHLLQRHDILVVKVDSTSTRGWPDLTAILPNGEVWFIELKTKTGRLSEHQKRIREEIEKRDGNYAVIKTIEEAEQLLTDRRSTLPPKI